MNIYVKKVDGVILPEKGTQISAGYDIVATSKPKIVGIQHEIQHDTNKLYWDSIDYIEYETNLFIAPSIVTTHTLIYPRSSISRYNLILANSIGLIDNDYRGMILCRFKYMWQPMDLISSGNQYIGRINIDKIYEKGDKIAQLVIAPTIKAEFELVNDLTKTDRGEGGFGSTNR